MAAYQTIEVGVEGGVLRVGIWGDQGPVLLCSHGITANHMSFSWLAKLLGERCRLVALDHRGRGCSRHITGPWGMEHHAADVVAVLDHLQIEKADVMVGHSMGGFVSAVTQATYPQRVGNVLMVDGGLPLADEIPQGITPEQLVQAVIGPAMQRLDMTFESVEDYYAFWRQHPAFADDSEWSDELKAYFAYDLAGEAPALQPGVNKAAIIGDTESQLMTDIVAESIGKLSVPVRFLQAPRGIMNDAPLYPLERLELFRSRITDFDYRQVDDVNHYSILLSRHGVQAVVDQIDELLAL